MWGCLPLSPNCITHFPTHPLYPKLPYTPISVAPSLVSTHIYLCSLTFSLKPDEAASVCRQKKLVFKNVIYCFVLAPWRYYIIYTDRVSNLFSYMYGIFEFIFVYDSMIYRLCRVIEFYQYMLYTTVWLFMLFKYGCDIHACLCT